MQINNLITEHIDTWSSAVKKKSATGRGSSKKYELYGIKKLRELILDLAVRGKLVPQNPKDEPASDLLERIADEKEQLFKDKKIKKPKKYLIITKNDEAFELPNGWEWTRLGTIGNIFNGNSVNAKLKAEKYMDIDGLPFIATKDVQYGFEELDYHNGVNIPIDEPKFKVAHKGAVLICSEGGSAGKKCGLANQDICFGNKLYANELYGNINARYILSAYLTPTFYRSFSKSMTGIIGGISTAKFSELLIPVPPLDEQDRIVAKVDELTLLCDQLEQQTESNIDAHKTLVEVLLNTLTDSKDSAELHKNWAQICNYFETLFTTEHSIDQLKQTILQLAVMGKLVPQSPNDEPASKLVEFIKTEKDILTTNKKIKKQEELPPSQEEYKSFKLPTGWTLCRVSSLINPKRDISYGIIKLGDEPTSNGIPTLRCSDVKPRYINLSGVRNVSPEIEAPYKRTRLEGGEVLVNIRGTLGGVALVPEQLKGHNIAREVAMLPIHSSVSAEFIVNLIASPYFWSLIEKNLKGIAYKGLNLNLLRNFLLPIPPYDEQIRINEKVEQLMHLCEQLKKDLKQIQNTQINLTDSLVKNMDDLCA